MTSEISNSFMGVLQVDITTRMDEHIDVRTNSTIARINNSKDNDVGPLFSVDSEANTMSLQEECLFYGLSQSTHIIFSSSNQIT